MQTSLLITKGAVWNKRIEGQVHTQQMSGHITGFPKLTIHAKQTYSYKCILLDNASLPSNILKTFGSNFQHKRVLLNERSRSLLQILSDRIFCGQPDYTLVLRHQIMTVRICPVSLRLQQHARPTSLATCNQ